VVFGLLLAGLAVLAEILELNQYDEYEKQAKEQAKEADGRRKELDEELKRLMVEINRRPEYERQKEEAETLLEAGRNPLRRQEENLTNLKTRQAQLQSSEQKLSEARKHASDMTGSDRNRPPDDHGQTITAATRIRTSRLVHFEMASEYVVVTPETALSAIFLRNGRITATRGVAQAATCARLLNKRDPWPASTCGLAAPKEPNMMRNTAKCSSNTTGSAHRMRMIVATLANALRQRRDRGLVPIQEPILEPT
jgi:hypothetical protein